MTMTEMIDLLMESLEVDKLTLTEAEEALYYLDLHLDQDGDLRETIKLIELKSKVLQHMTKLELVRTN